jgi:hypothetical protein
MIGLVLRDVAGMVVAGVLISTTVALTLSGLARSTPRCLSAPSGASR